MLQCMFSLFVCLYILHIVVIISREIIIIKQSQQTEPPSMISLAASSLVC